MTDFDKPVKRRTCGAYRFTITGAYPDSNGERLVVELRGDAHGDHIRIREKGRRTWIELDVATLYVRGIQAKALAEHRAKRKAKGKAKGKAKR